MLIFFLFFSFFPLILGFQPSNSSLIGDSFGDLSFRRARKPLTRWFRQLSRWWEGEQVERRALASPPSPPLSQLVWERYGFGVDAQTEDLLKSDLPCPSGLSAWPCYAWDLPCWLPAFDHRIEINLFFILVVTPCVGNFSKKFTFTF